MFRNNVLMLLIERSIVELPDWPLAGLMLSSFGMVGVLIGEPPKDQVNCRLLEFKSFGVIKYGSATMVSPFGLMVKPSDNAFCHWVPRVGSFS